MECNTGKVIDLGSLYRRFERLTDDRRARGKRYSLAMILMAMFLAKLCGEDKPSGIAEWVAHRGEWMARVLELQRTGMPSHHAYRRTLKKICEAEFEALARAHFRHHGRRGYQVVVSLDGKAIRGTMEAGSNQGLWLLAVFLPGEGVTLAQVAIESKENEISAAPRLLDYIDLREKVVIGDALHTQKALSIQIGKAGGDFVWTVKGNHPQLLEDLADWFDPKVTLLPGMGSPPKDFRTATTTSKGHGRLEVRSLTASSQLNDFLDWPFLQQVFKLERQVTISRSGQTRREVVYGLTSLSADEACPARLLDMLRSYWQIENGLHYPSDVSLHEDHTRFKHHAAAHNMAILNNLVLGLITQAGFPFVPTARRYYNAHPDQAFALLAGL